METKPLLAFQHLARSLHFGKTAQALHMSPSTLSRVVQRLERQLDCALLIRDNRTVELTDAGKNFLEYSDKQLENWRLLQDQLNKTNEQLSGKLSIFCSVTAAYSHLPPILDRFRHNHPSVEIILNTGDPADALNHVLNQSVDIAIAAKPEKLANKLIFKELAQIPLSVIIPAFSSAIKEALREPTIDWKNIPIILPEHGPARRRFSQWFKNRCKDKPQIYATVSGHEALVSMVALGCGLGIAPKVVVENSPVRNRVEFVDNLGKIKPFELGISCLQQQQNKPLVNAFIDCI
ncbi:MAG: HTH-type transcriptional activator IlvY [Kangiellaceae bacterium]|nr:HTH-type transcriptional activator IlvY [Kangiellaceae bacterium]